MASRRYLKALLALSILAGGAAISHQADAGGGAVSEEAKTHFKAGVNALRDPDGERPGDAYVQFKLAYDKSNHNWKVLGNLALSAMKIERHGEAIKYYTLYLKEGGDQIPEQERTQIKKDLLELRSSVAHLKLSADMATFRVDDVRSRSRDSITNHFRTEQGTITIGVKAGTHKLVAKADNGKSSSWEIYLSPGDKKEHFFELKADAGGPVIAPPPPVKPAKTEPEKKPEESSGNGLRTGGWITAGVGGALLVTGAVFGLMANSKFSDLEAKCTGVQCDTDAQSLKDDVESLDSTANIMFIAGGILAVGGLSMVFLSPAKDKESMAAKHHVLPRPQSVQLAPSVTPQGMGLFATGRF